MKEETIQYFTYARGLKAVNQYHLSPTSGTVIVRTRATLARLRQVQNVRKSACPRLGTIIPSNLQSAIEDIFKMKWPSAMMHRKTMLKVYHVLEKEINRIVSNYQ